MTINARNENDVEEDDIINKVSKASGANYSFHKEQKRPDPGSGPVVCVIQFYIILYYCLLVINFESNCFASVFFSQNVQISIKFIHHDFLGFGVPESQTTN